MIYHITSKDWWRRFSDKLFFESADLSREGFIHCSTKEQVAATLQRYFPGQKGLVLLHIDSNELKVELKFEVATNGQLFPHVYGKINREAIVRIEDIV